LPICQNRLSNTHGHTHVIPTEPVRLAALAQGRLRERRDLPRYGSESHDEHSWLSDARQISTM
ncbi:MAG: hypothetical protein KY432_10610, partial [Acidobacteria bacterium]|nr:hypothetical protein [Acidobacteriota bacterium]